MKSENKILIAIIIGIIVLIALVGVLFMMNKSLEEPKKENNVVDTEEQAVNNVIENNVNEDIESDYTEKIENIATQTFNAQFTPYKGTNINASQIKALISAVNMNNSINNEHIVNFDEDGITDVNEVEKDKTYTVNLSYDDDGYINKIQIKDTSDNNESFEALVFNQKFAQYEGLIDGEQLGNFILEAIKSNQENREHQINPVSTNLEDFSNIQPEEKYVVIFSYDEDGYIRNVNIDLVDEETINRLNMLIELNLLKYASDSLEETKKAYDEWELEHEEANISNYTN